jgi:hypothetical protein
MFVSKNAPLSTPLALSCASMRFVSAEFLGKKITPAPFGARAIFCGLRYFRVLLDSDKASDYLVDKREVCGFRGFEV